MKYKITNQWIGCFHIGISKNKTMRLGHQVIAELTSAYKGYRIIKSNKRLFKLWYRMIEMISEHKDDVIEWEQ